MARFNNGKKVSLVVQFQAVEKAPTLPVDALDALGKYFYIVHDKDTNEEGEVKGLHAHLVIFAKEGRSSANWIDLVALLFKVDRSAVSVEIVRNDKSALRYLVHETADAKALHKYRYANECVVSNALDKFNEALAVRCKASNEELLSCEDEKQLLDLVGWEKYNKALQVWKSVKPLLHEVNENEVETADGHRIAVATQRLGEMIKKYRGMDNLVQDLNNLQLFLIGIDD